MSPSPKSIVFTAPSGAGKTTIVRHLLKTFDEVGFSVSATTRKKRKHEEEGRDYYFLTPEEFEEKIKSSAFIEWEEVYERQFYGTLKSEVERNHKEGKTVVFDMDVKGAQSIKDYYGKHVLVVFIRPPSLQILMERLKARKSENESSLKKRAERARLEMSYENSFDLVLVNDLLDVALQEAELIVRDFLDLH